jgi:hypothetical protein
MDTIVVGVLDPMPGTCTNRMVSVRPLPTSPPVASSACYSGVRPWRLSEPTSSHVVPLAAAGRPG